MIVIDGQMETRLGRSAADPTLLTVPLDQGKIDIGITPLLTVTPTPRIAPSVGVCFLRIVALPRSLAVLGTIFS